MKRKTDSQGEKKSRKRAKSPSLAIRLSVAVLSPIIFLLLIELILRLGGYGQPENFFIRWKAAGETVYLSNKHYCEHFVPKELSRSPESSVLHSKNKSTIRIFILGGSAAYGDPDPAYGFCRQLEVLLNEHLSDDSQDSGQNSFEVINAAVTSMNSHVARRIAKDCAAHGPDIFIIYMGNNEVVGPYGPPTLPAILYSSRGFINTCITAKKEIRIGQLVKNFSRALRTSGRPEKKWLGMEAFLTSQITHDDEKLKYCYQHFRDNISDIIQTASKHGAKTILCTVPTNIRACAPFGSKHKRDLTKEQISEWDQHFKKGRELELSGDFEAALARYEEAGAIDKEYAELAFCIGKCLSALGRIDEARREFIEARDLDTLRFRADSRINSIIRQTAETQANRGVVLLDLEENADGYLSGEEIFLDHVHLNFRGNFLAAYAAMQTVRRILPQAELGIPKQSEQELLEQNLRRLLYDDHERYRLAMDMYRRKTLPPFAGQINHETELAGLRQTLFRLRRDTKTSNDSETRYLDAIEHAPFDSYLNKHYGQFLLKNGRIADAIRMYEKILKAQPFNMSIRIALAQALAQGGMKDEAINMLTSQESPNRYNRKEALLMLGTCYVRNRRFLDAETIYQELNQLEPDNVDVLINLAAAGLYRKDFDAMKRILDKVLEIQPESVQAMINMGNYYAKRNQPDEARKWFLKAVRADPQSYLAQINLGVQTIRVGNLKEGMKHVIKAVLLKPDFAEGYKILAQIYSELGKESEAKKYADLRDLFQ
jgi:tetratricopeptide (TPR) repeat protein